MIHCDRANPTLVSVICLLGCQPQMRIKAHQLVDASEQIVVVVTPDWASTTGTMQRFERATPPSDCNSLPSAVPVVVGRTGIAWGVEFDGVSGKGPHKHEGDGKAPAGVFPLDTAVGFAPRDSMPTVKLPYFQLVLAT